MKGGIILSDSVGGVSFDLTFDTSKLETSISNIAANAQSELSSAFANVAEHSQTAVQNITNNVQEAIQNTSNNVQEAVNSVSSEIEQTANETDNKIQQILNDTERSVQSKVGSISAIYKKQGMNQAEAMQKAWSHIERTSENSNKSQTKHFRNAWRKIVTHSWNSSEKVKKSFSGISNKAQKSAESMKSSFGGAFKKIAGAAAAAFSAAAVVKFGKDCIESAANVNAANSQLSQTFGDLQGSAEAAMKRVADSSGIVQSRLQGVGTSIYAFAKTTGMDSANALSMMEEALQVTADSAAYYDRSLEDTAESLKSFLKGNYENDAALGLSCTETTRNTAANKLYGKSFQDLSESQKQLTLLQMVKDANQLSGAMGQAAREADGWENVTGNLKEAWNQLLAVIGQPILQAATVIVQNLTSAIQTLTEYAKMASNALSEMFGWGGNNAVTASVSSAANSAGALSSSTAESTDNLNKSTKAAEKLKKAVAGFDQLNILSADTSESDDNTNDIQGEITPIVNTSSAENNLQKSFGDIKKNIEDLFKNSGIDDFVKEIQKGISEIDFAKIGSNFELIMQSLKPIAQATFNGLQKISKSFMKSLGKVIGGVSKVVGKSVEILSGGVAKWLSSDKDKIAGYISTMSDDVSSCLDNLGSASENILNIVTDSMTRMGPQIENAIANLLSGTSTLLGSLGIIITGAFDGAAQVINQWTIDNQELIGTFCDNVFQAFDDLCNLVGKVFSDLGESLTQWWNSGGGKELWDSVCQTVMDVGTIILEVINEWIMPIWDALVVAANSLWNDCLKPIFDKLIAVITKLWNEIIYPLWENLLKPLCDWIVKVLGPVFKTVFNVIGEVCKDCFSVIGGVIGGILDALGGLIDFISGVFTGDWEKAWKGISDFFKGIWDGIWSIIKFIINLIIDGINMLWSGIYYAVKGIVDSIGGISGALGSLFGQDWSFSMPAEPPLIPKLAKGGLATAPTLAMVGDNPNASSDPEVISPLSKLKGMIAETQQTTVCDERVIRMLQKIYDLLNSEETQYVNNTYLDSELIERKIVKVRKRKNRRYGGALNV